MKLAFANHKRFEKWIEIEKTYISFFLNRKYLDPEVVENVLDRVRVSSFDIVSNCSEISSEFESFKEVIISQNSLLNKPCFRGGLSYANFVDTSNALFIKEWAENFIPAINLLRDLLKKRALEHKNTLQIGRTHGIDAEPNSFGHKFSVLYSDLGRYIDFIFESRSRIECVYVDWYGLNDPGLALEIRNYMASELGLRSYDSNSPSCSIGKYVDFLSNLNAVSQLIAKLARDLSDLSSDIISEVSFSDECRKMLKDIKLEAKFIDNCYESFVSLTGEPQDEEWFKNEGQYLLSSMDSVENIVSWMNRILETMQVNEDVMYKKLEPLNVYSQMFMLYLLRRSNFDRKAVLSDVKQLLLKTSTPISPVTFKTAILQSDRYGSYVNESDLAKLTDPRGFLNNIDEVYRRIFTPSYSDKYAKVKKWSESEIEFCIDGLASSLNEEYFHERHPVSIMCFSDDSLVFLGRLTSKLRFPTTLTIFPNVNKKLSISDVKLNENLLFSKRILIVNFSSAHSDKISEFRTALEKKILIKDVKICTLLKYEKTEGFTDVEDHVDFYAFKCPHNHFYIGFGKEGDGEQEFGANLPYIGLSV